ncbi:MAG TPA: GNAT family N-acetyltransferase [Micromonosporaceae bacterium]|jgi:ribosomal protein S18 acetylase RimI-like enzyme
MPAVIRPEPIVIRAATPDDFAAIAELTVEAYEADGQLGPETTYRSTLANVAGRASAGQILVAVEGCDVLGAVLLVWPGSVYSELAGAGEAEFRMLAVAPKAQRRGIGERLVRACLDHARAGGAERVVISARDFVEAAQRLYARMGFIRLPERDWTPVPGVHLVALQFDLTAALD